MTRLYLGLGANIGNRTGNLRMALRLLSRQCLVVRVSSLYRSEALVLEGQPPGPDFYNAVCAIDTDLDPAAVLAFVKEIEREIGRRPGERWAPRPIDIDILLYGDEQIDAEGLAVPHPSLPERNFVLLPLAEIAPDVVHPALHRVIADLADDADFAGLEHVSGPDWAAPEAAPSFDTADGVRWNDREEGHDHR